jgi:hypothetical protein
MAMTTTDVVTNIISGNEVQRTGSIVVYCQRTGEYNTADVTYEKHVTYNGLESLYTDRFDDVTYYTVGTNVIVGG